MKPLTNGPKMCTNFVRFFPTIKKHFQKLIFDSIHHYMFSNVRKKGFFVKMTFFDFLKAFCILHGLNTLAFCVPTTFGTTFGRLLRHIGNAWELKNPFKKSENNIFTKNPFLWLLENISVCVESNISFSE